MNLSEMRAEFYAEVKDPSISTADVTKKLNDALEYTAGEVKIPDLKRFDVIQTVRGQAFTMLSGLSGGFSGKLLKVGSGDSVPKIRLYPSLERLVDDYGTLEQNGSVEAICLEGSQLWYAKVPLEPALLPIVYLQLPEKLVDEEDEPKCIPRHLHRLCLVYRACEYAYNSIEDGLEGEKVNTMRFRSLADDGNVKLMEHIARCSPHQNSTMWRY